MNLYLRRFLLATIACLLVWIGWRKAAGEQRQPAHVLRATSLLELTTDAVGTVTTHLYPITILDHGQFYDATLYKSRPQPMALGDGVVYEAQKTGIPVGYVTLNSAAQNGGVWVASGEWEPVDKSKSAQQAKPKPIDVGDDRPILHRENQTSGIGAPPAGSQPSTEASSQPSSSQPAATEDPDRPVLRRRDDKQTQPKPAAPAPAGAGLPAVPTTKTSGFTPGTETLVAVSDEQPTDTRSFDFIWKPGEKEQIEAKVRKLALAQLPRENSQLTEASLKNVVIRSFDLDLSNDAVVVLTAEVPGSYLTAGKGAQPGKFVSRYITLITRVDYDGNLRKLSSSVTDSSRLDVVPRLELVDAVDVDGDGLAELLFKEYSFDEMNFIIYGVGRSTVTKVFEGAAQPLH